MPHRPLIRRAFSLFCFSLALTGVGLLSTGCRIGPQLVQEPASIDRALVEYPAGFDLKPYISGLTAPSAIAFDADGSLLIAESGTGDTEPRIIGFKKNGTFFQVYPSGRTLPLLYHGFRLYGPIGGIVASGGKVFVTHRDENGNGRVTAFSYDPSVEPQTVAAGFPTLGDYGMSDIAVHPNGRLYFGVGAATNSSVVGLDNLQNGWVKRHRNFCDVPFTDIKLNGFRFDTNNPFSSIFGGKDIAVTGPFQKFGASDQTSIPRPPPGRATSEKPGAAVFSVEQGGGDLKVEAHGIRYPAGLTFNEYGTLYITNQGMELRGTRPVSDDPDAFLKMVGGETWYGWPDYSADLRPITEEGFQPPRDLAIRYGYPNVRFVIDHAGSRLIPPAPGPMLFGTFRPLAGASKFGFAPGSGPFRQFRGEAIVALAGDRAPFATSGRPLRAATGYRVVKVNIDTRKVDDFVKNTRELPASRLGRDALAGGALERPIDVKFGPDGAMYILDFGQMQMKNGKSEVTRGTGKILRLTGVEAPVAVGQAK
jgi:glucose/arabinose dehydrogenase